MRRTYERIAERELIDAADIAARGGNVDLMLTIHAIIPRIGATGNVVLQWCNMARLPRRPEQKRIENAYNALMRKDHA